MNLKKVKDLNSLSKEQLITLIKDQREDYQDLQDSINGSQFISWVYDIESEKLVFAQGSTRLFGERNERKLSYEDLVARVHPEDKELMALNFMSYIEKYPASHEYYLRILDFDNNYRWMASRGTLFRDDIGVAYKIAGTLRDVSQKKLLEDENVLHETRYQFVSEHAKEGIIIYNKHKTITDLSQGAENIFGYKRDEIVGMHLDNIIDQKTAELLERSKNTGDYTDFYGIKKNGEGIYLEFLNRESPLGVGMFIINNIHSRKVAELELLRYQKELEQLVEVRTAELNTKNAELKESKRAFQALLENLQGMAYQYIPQGDDWKVTFISKGSEEMTGYSPKDFKSDEIRVDRDLVVTGYNEAVWDEIQECLKNKKDFYVQYPIITKSGAEKWILDRGIGVYDDKGNLISLDGLMVDITREKLQEEKLLIAQEEILAQRDTIAKREYSLSNLLTNLQGMAYRVLDDLTTVSYISDGCYELTGYTKEEIMNTEQFFETQIVRAEFQGMVAEIIDKAIKNNQSYEVNYPIVCKDKTEKWVTERGVGLYDEEGQLEALEGFIIDISRSKELEKQLRLAQETIDKAPIMIQWIKEDGSFSYVNEETLLASQYSREDFKKKKVYEIAPYLDKEEWSKIFNQRKYENLREDERVYRRKDQSHFPIFVNATNIDYEGISYNIAYINDITDLKKIEEDLKEANDELSASEEELRQQSEELQTLNENLEQQKQELETTVFQLKNTREQLIHNEKMASLGVLVAGIAHELNNPIGYIKTSSEALDMLLDDLQEELLKSIESDSQMINELSGDLKKMSGNIYSGAVQAAEIVKGLRVFSRMDKEKIEKHDISSTINNVLLMLANSYKYDIKIHKDFEDLPPIECAPGQINQVFMNLINNAIQSIKGKGNVWIHSKLHDNRVIISVTDDGKGIPEKLKSRIFEPFFTTKEPGEGTGLGLSISLGIIQDHNGSIDFTSSEKKTTFTISLPLNQDDFKN